MTCKEHKGGTTGGGYGRMYGHTTVYAHRHAWEEVNGKIPEGMFVLHKCDNRKCINVDHLYLGTHADNMRDMKVRGRTKSNGVPLPSESQIAELLRRFAAGEHAAPIARDLGINPSQARRLVREAIGRGLYV